LYGWVGSRWRGCQSLASHQSSGGAPFVSWIVSSVEKLPPRRVSSAAFPVVARRSMPLAVRACVFADPGPRTASRSNHRLSSTVATVTNDVAGRNLSPNAPTGGLGRVQVSRLRTRHCPAGDG